MFCPVWYRRNVHHDWRAGRGCPHVSATTGCTVDVLKPQSFPSRHLDPYKANAPSIRTQTEEPSKSSVDHYLGDAVFPRA